MTAGGNPIDVRRDGAVSWITFNQPDKLNAFDVAAVDEFSAALREAEGDSGTRCVVVTGAGRAFSAGADVNHLSQVQGPGELGPYLRDHWAPVFRRLMTMPKPVLCGVNGVAAGIAASIALACDLRVASEDAYLLEAFAKIGLGPDGGASWLLPRLVGRGKALEMFFLARPLSATEAKAAGVFNLVVPAADLERTCQEWAQQLAAAPRVAVMAAKRAVNHADTAGYEEAFEFESYLQDVCAGQPSFREGVTAFMEKRTPDFVAVDGD